MVSEGTTPSVDIIIPVYKAEKYLPGCIECLKNQTYKNFRVLFVDDCSPDKSREMIKEYEAAYPFVKGIYCDKNGGAANARNVGLDNSDADYICFLDSDDTLEAAFLERLIGAALEYGADITQCGYKLTYPDKSIGNSVYTFKNKTVLDRKDFKSVYMKMFTGIAMNQIVRTVFKKETVGSLRMMTDLKTSEDLTFFSCVLTGAQKYVYLPEPLYNYYRSGTGLTGSSLSFGEKWSCVRRSSRTLADNLKITGELTFKYRLLSVLRPYILVLSKLVRVIRKS